MKKKKCRVMYQDETGKHEVFKDEKEFLAGVETFKKELAKETHQVAMKKFKNTKYNTYVFTTSLRQDLNS